MSKAIQQFHDAVNGSFDRILAIVSRQKFDANEVPALNVLDEVAELEAVLIDIDGVYGPAYLEAADEAVRERIDNVRRSYIEAAQAARVLDPRTDQWGTAWTALQYSVDELRPFIAAEKTESILLNADGCYLIGGESFAVSDNEDSVLQSFVDRPAMDTDTLIRLSGVDLAPRVLRGLTTKYGGKFGPYITLPGGKGKGGYAVNIRRAQ